MDDLQTIPHVAICALRGLGLFVILPLGWDLMGLSARISIAAALAFLIAPQIPPPLDFTTLDVALEILVGMVMGLPAALLLEGAATIGELFDALRGQSIATVYEPLQQQVLPLSGTYAKWALWALLLGSGSALQLSVAIVESFHVLPLGGLSLTELPALSSNLLRYIPSILAATFVACLPFACLCVAVELVLAFAAKQLSGVSLCTEGFLAKYIIALGCVVVTLDSELILAFGKMALPIKQLLLP